MFVVLHPWPTSAFFRPVRWGRGSAAGFGVAVPVVSRTDATKKITVLGYRLSISGSVTVPVGSVGEVALELRAGAIVLDRILHLLTPFRPAQPTGGIVFVPTRGVDVSARCDVAIDGVPVTPAASDPLFASAAVWGLEEIDE